MRLLAVIEAYSITGPAKNLIEFARHAATMDVSTTIVTFTRDQADNLFTKTIRDLASSNSNISLEIIPERGAFDFKAVQRVRELVKRLQPTVVQTHAVKSHFFARLASLHKLAPWVAFHHGYTWPNRKMRLYNQLDRWSLKVPRKILTVSRPFRDELVAFGIPGERIEIIHNAISPTWGAASRDPETAAKLRAQAGIPENRKVILIVGRLSREKDHVTLVEAVSRLRPQLNAHLVIVGDGPERSRLEEKILSLNLKHSVSFTGQQSSAEPWYGIADVAVLSSLSEGSPNALLEAMATSVPVVATRVGGIPEIVTDQESALLVNPGDAQAMSAALTRILTQPELADCLKSRAKQLIRERHDPGMRMERLLSIYQQLVGT